MTFAIRLETVELILFIAAISYLLGSIPFGYLLVRIFRGEDVRASGSGNIGATNVARKSPVLGVLTLLLDALKGFAAVAFGIFASLPIIDPPPPHAIIFHADFPGVAFGAAFAGLCAVLGHMFPVWLKFRGGKGVATGLGAFAIFAPKAVLAAAAIFMVIVLVFRYVSLGSIVAVCLFPTLTWTFREFGKSWAALGCVSLASLAIVLKHHGNIGRLLAGRENRLGSKPGVKQGNP